MNTYTIYYLLRGRRRTLVAKDVSWSCAVTKLPQGAEIKAGVRHERTASK